MPVTKTASRALRGSTKKETINKLILKNLEIAIRLAKRNKAGDLVLKASSLADRAAKKHTIHKNKAARIKSQLAKLITKKTSTQKVSVPKKSSNRKTK